MHHPFVIHNKNEGIQSHFEFQTPKIEAKSKKQRKGQNRKNRKSNIKKQILCLVFNETKHYFNEFNKFWYCLGLTTAHCVPFSLS